MEIAPLDIVFGVLVVFMAIRVAVRGFIAEVMSFAALILAVASAVLFSGTLALYIEAYVGPSLWNPVIAFLVIFLFVYFLIKIFENVLRKALTHIHLDKLDRALGLFLGIAEGLVIVSLAIFVLQLQPFFEVTGLLEASIFVRLLLPLMPYLHDTFSRGFGTQKDV